MQEKVYSSARVNSTSEMAAVKGGIQVTSEAHQQISCTVIFEYIELGCKRQWRPDTLRVLWQYGKWSTISSPLMWNPEAIQDKGAEGAAGVLLTKAEVTMVIAPCPQGPAEAGPMECTFTIVNDGPSGSTELATARYDIAQCISAMSTGRELDLVCRPLSENISMGGIGVTLKTCPIELPADVPQSHSPADVPQPHSPADVPQPHSPADVPQPHSPADVPQPHSPADVNSLPLVSPNELTLTQTSPSPAVDMAVASWLRECSFVNATGAAVPVFGLAMNDLILLYFSASWCPPCQKFLPKLIAFYEHLKFHRRSFEIVYISSDHSETDMLLYMNKKEIPWIALKFDQGDRVRAKIGIDGIPSIIVITPTGESVVSVGVKKDVISVCGSTTSTLKLFDHWKEMALQ